MFTSPSAPPATAPATASAKVDVWSSARVFGDARFASTPRARPPRRIDECVGNDGVVARARWTDMTTRSRESGVAGRETEARRLEDASRDAPIAVCAMNDVLNYYRAMDLMCAILPGLACGFPWMFKDCFREPMLPGLALDFR